MLLSCIGIRLYVLNLEAELGVKFPVPKPVELEEYYDAPAFITEFRSRWQVRSHDNFEEAKKAQEREETLAQLLVSLAEFSDGLHLEMLHEHKKEFIALARNQAEDPSFKIARNAAWILDHFGDKEAYFKIRQRLVELYATEPRPSYRPFYDFTECFGRERVAKDQKFVQFARSLINEPNQLDWVSSSFLFYENVDDEPYYQYMLRKAKNGRDKSYSFIWLVENRYTPEVKIALAEYLDSGQVPSYSRVREFIEIENGDPDWLPTRNRIEKLGHRFLSETESRLWKVERDRHWGKFTECATEASVEFFINAFENTKGQEKHRRSQRILLSCQALDRLGHRKEAETLLIAALEADKNDDPYAFTQTKRQMFDLAEKFWGRTEIIKLCKEHIEHDSDHGACEKLADMFAGTKNEEIASLIADCGDIARVEKIGSNRLPEMWKSASSRKRTYTLYSRWKSQRLERQDFVDWINTELGPGKPLTIQQVLAHPKHLEKNRHWEIKSPVIDTDHQFALVALAHSGNGNLVETSNNRDDLLNILEKLSKSAQPEFCITSTNENWTGGTLNFSLVVNKRLYKFSIPESRYIVEDESTEDVYFDGQYPMEAALEILNAIAIRQHLQGRFFIFDGEGLGPQDINLVAFLTRAQVEELDTKFGLTPRQEFEFYLDHQK